MTSASNDTVKYLDRENKVEDTVFFDSDQFSLTEATRKTLTKQINWLNKNPSINIILEGLADKKPGCSDPNGSAREYNLALGESRAQEVSQFLKINDIQSSRISTISYGKERPISEEDLQANRRVLTKIIEL